MNFSHGNSIQISTLAITSPQHHLIQCDKTNQRIYSDSQRIHHLGRQTNQKASLTHKSHPQATPSLLIRSKASSMTLFIQSFLQMNPPPQISKFAPNFNGQIQTARTSAIQALSTLKHTCRQHQSTF